MLISPKLYAWNHIIFFSLVSFFVSCQPAKDPALNNILNHGWVSLAPAGNAYCHIQPKGTTIIPNGRKITPLGNTITIAPHPFGLVLSPDGETAITANSGTSPISVSIIKDLSTAQPTIMQIPEGYQTDRGILASTFMGLAVTPDNDKVYVSGGQSNKIYVFSLMNGEKVDSIDGGIKLANDPHDFSHGYIGDLVLSKDGKRLFGVDQVNFCLFIIDTEQMKVVQRVQVGRYPFGIALSPDETEVYIANVGVFEYRPIESVDPERVLETALHFPPFAYDSKEMREGIETDSLKVPGLGDPNVPESFSVWSIKLPEGKVSSKVKTGILVGEKVEGIPAVGGASPNSVVATDQYVFVSNGSNDCISVIDTELDTVVKNIFLGPDPRMERLRGVIPFGLALSPDHKRLYVAESGINAVGVIDVERLALIGHLPVGWWPSKLAVSPNGQQLIVANAKGFGSGPNGGADFQRDDRGQYIGALMAGTVSVIDIPSDEALERHTQTVIQNNFDFRLPSDPVFKQRANNPIPLYPTADNSPIKYIVFIIKENRTYDQVFGQLPDGKGDSTNTDFGFNANVSNRDGSRTVEKVDVMVNHLALARQFAISDNFYVDADHSADGHKWLADTYPNEWAETEVISAYAGGRNQVEGSEAPGNLAVNAANGSIIPEDYNEAGSIWEHLERNGLSFFNWGAGIMFAPNLTQILDRATDKNAGYKYVYNYPLNAPLFTFTSRTFPTYNTGIPEQFRADMFIEEFTERFLGANEEDPAPEALPRVLFIYYGIDHGDRERPEDGYPFRASYMADNDLALGRTIEFLSHTPYWKEMAIFVTEDDSQDGRDHIDAHRSILMAISPYVKRGYVGHVHYSFGSIFKTFWNILGVPYLNQYDAGPTDLADLFTDKPDFTPYQALPVDIRIFDPQLALDPLDEDFNWKAVEESAELDKVEDFVRLWAERSSVGIIGTKGN